MELFERLLPEWITEWQQATTQAKRDLVTKNFFAALIAHNGKPWLAANAIEIQRRIKEAADAPPTAQEEA